MFPIHRCLIGVHWEHLCLPSTPLMFIQGKVFFSQIHRRENAHAVATGSGISSDPGKGAPPAWCPAVNWRNSGSTTPMWGPEFDTSSNIRNTYMLLQLHTHILPPPKSLFHAHKIHAFPMRPKYPGISTIWVFHSIILLLTSTQIL